jgi:toxin FitB
MFLLDTHVVSELTKPEADPQVLAWLDAQSPGALYWSSIVWYELLVGLECAPEGRKKTALRQTLLGVRNDFFSDRVLAFDEAAATAMAHGLTVVARDTAPFVALGVKTLNPWNESTPVP